eukprot:6491727-Amphidinium_carterae.1
MSVPQGSTASLQVSGIPIQQPIATIQPKELFDKLCEQFCIDPAVSQYLVNNLGLETLQDFKFLFTDEQQVEATVTNNLPDLSRAPLQAARLRQAWASVHAAANTANDLRKRGRESEDFDSLLPQEDLTSLKYLFYARYKLDFAITVEPSDFLVSRLAKELQQRLLQVHSVFKVKSLTHQLRAERKKRSVGDGLVLVLADSEADEPVARTLSTYIQLHLTLMIAYARAVVKPLEPQPTVVETYDTDAHLYVEAPLNVLLKYHHRLVQVVSQFPVERALQFIQLKDEEERQIWVQKHRSSSTSLGAIIHQTLTEREGCWTDASHPQQPRPDVRPALPRMARGATPKSAPQRPAPAVPTPDSSKIRTADKLRDGKTICRKWNSPVGCSEPCPFGRLHVCNAVTSAKSRVCGLKNHRSFECTRGAKA